MRTKKPTRKRRKERLYVAISSTNSPCTAVSADAAVVGDWIMGLIKQFGESEEFSVRTIRMADGEYAKLEETY